MIPSVCFAEFTVNSATKNFDILTGDYHLTGNVIVKFPVQNSTMSIKGDQAVVQTWQQELHANGNIKLSWENLNFSCDRVDVYHTDKTAYLSGKLFFKANGNHITADTGTYCWKTKLARFNGNVTVNGVAKPGTVTYSFNGNSFL